MESFEPYQILLLIVAVAYTAFLFGRATGARNSGEGRNERLLREAHNAERTFSGIEASKQVELDRLLTDGKMIAAIKEIRQLTGLGLKDAKATADYRRRILSGSS